MTNITLNQSLSNSNLNFIDPKLINDCFYVTELELSIVLLMNDCNYPWLILVPKYVQAYDLTDLDYIKQRVLLEEINLCGEFLKENFQVDKLNIASLGNVVRQLHVHVIARSNTDLTYPKPVWGNSIAKPYQLSIANKIISDFKIFINKKINNHG